MSGRNRPEEDRARHPRQQEQRDGGSDARSVLVATETAEFTVAGDSHATLGGVWKWPEWSGESISQRDLA